MARRDPNFIDVHVGNRIRMRRQIVGTSQEKLGELLGITFQQVQKYEKGTNRISASRLYYCAKTLGVPVQFFFEDLPGGDNAGGLGEPRDSDQVMAALMNVDGVTWYQVPVRARLDHLQVTRAYLFSAAAQLTDPAQLAEPGRTYCLSAARVAQVRLRSWRVQAAISHISSRAALQFDHPENEASGFPRAGERYSPSRGIVLRTCCVSFP
jgi:transcriptional regulator with XRE-family HTH domain